MHMDTCTQTHTPMDTCTHTHGHTQRHRQTHTQRHMHTQKDTRRHMCTQTCMRIHVDTCVQAPGAQQRERSTSLAGFCSAFWTQRTCSPVLPGGRAASRLLFLVPTLCLLSFHHARSHPALQTPRASEVSSPHLPYFVAISRYWASSQSHSGPEATGWAAHLGFPACHT